MKGILIGMIVGATLLAGVTCAPRSYSPIVVRPATCSDDVQFAESPDLSYLLAFADKMHKPVFLNFYTPWIESCTRMDQQVFTQDALASYFNHHFINYWRWHLTWKSLRRKSIFHWVQDDAASFGSSLSA